MKYRWLLPTVILIILITAQGLRYTTEASKSIDEYAVKWVRDRWTTDTWIFGYSFENTGKRLATLETEYSEKKQEAANSRGKILTWTWRVASGAVALWLAVSFFKDYKSMIDKQQ